MAISLSSSVVSRTLISSPSSFIKAKELGYSSVLFNSVNPFRLNYLSTPHTSAAAHHPRPSSRKLFEVRATVLQENEDKVVVEESFNPKSFPEKEGKGSPEPPEDSSSSGLEKWIIKLEQSINIFLTDSVIKILDTLYQRPRLCKVFCSGNYCKSSLFCLHVCAAHV
ncbi:ubiquinol oxidase 4 [Forsythia ovata]|uniref:Ubiquinol oxidase 4 n=1 Tax=Forsythia ovata TaxID=205694 RepID=A0ABD1R802_9LAMI